MIVLALDTALEDCAVALRLADGAIVRRVATVGRGHAEALMPAVAAVFAEAGIAPAAVDRIAVSIGPGSFTGLRVGVAAARGLALVVGRPAVGVSTLAAHAQSARAEAGAGSVLALLPARAGELYGQLFSAEGTPDGPAAVLSPEAALARAAAAGARLAGAGAPEGGVPVVHRRSAPAIEAVLALGQVLDPARHPALPLYVKPADAAPQTGGRIARR